MSDQQNDSPWNDPRITAFVLDEMSPEERIAFEKDVNESEALATAVEEARQVTDQVSALFQSELAGNEGDASSIHRTVLSADRRSAIIREPIITRLEDKKNGRFVLFAILGIAATLLVMLGLTPLFQADDMTVVSQLTPIPQEPVMGSSASATSVDTSSADLVEEESPMDLALSKRAVVAFESVAKEPTLKPKETKRKKTEGEVVQRSQYQAMEKAVDKNEGSIASTRGMARGGVMPMHTKMHTESFGALKSSMPAAPRRRMMKRSEHHDADDFGFAIDEGRGPGIAGDRFDPITDNAFRRVADHPLSTFSADVDTASYSKVRDHLMRAGRLPRPDAVRIEEMLNYFDYADAPPADDADHPFAVSVNLTACPWNHQHRLARIAIKGKTLQPKDRPACNLVFLIDTSGSMNAANKLPLVIDGMQMLVGQLRNDDKVAIVVYAGSAGLVLESTPAGKEKEIHQALENLSAGGSTNGGQGIGLAYQTARENFIEGGVNRVILCSDGDFNVGTTGTDALVRMVEQEAKEDIFLTVLGFGMGNHNDAMLEQVSGRGNGNYAFIDTQQEAQKVLVKQVAGTLVTIAKDVKLQVEFNPAQVSSYRLIGYENRILAKEDFNDDKKDAGEIGAGHSVIALYEIVPVNSLVDSLAKSPVPPVDALKYQSPSMKVSEKDSPKRHLPSSNETLTVKLRYKNPDEDTSIKMEHSVTDEGQSFDDASLDTRFSAAVAGFGMLLRGSPHTGDWEWSDVLKVAKASAGPDQAELRSEFIDLIQQAQALQGQ